MHRLRKITFTLCAVLAAANIATALSLANTEAQIAEARQALEQERLKTIVLKEQKSRTSIVPVSTSFAQKNSRPRAGVTEGRHEKIYISSIERKKGFVNALR